MRRLTLLLSILLFTACYDSAGEPDAHTEVPASTTSLAEIRRLFTGKTVEITSDIVIAGTVTTHDRTGNFYRSLVIEEEDAAAELMAGIDGLHNIYPEGYRLTISLKGLALGESHGILQIGRLPAAGSSYATDYIGSRAALDRHVFRSDRCSKIQPLVSDIASLTPNMAGRLVRIDNMRYSPKDLESNEWSGTRRFTDENGAEIYAFTRSYADFADVEIPLSELLLVGILQCDAASDGGHRYTLRLRDETDCWY